MTTEMHTTAVNMDGLFQVLGKNLYSTPAVAIRELVQNAHDACIRRKVEAKDLSSSELFIRVSTESAGRFLIIEDNGSGLTKDEVLEYLVTIGKGYTRVARDSLHNEEMIGYFGLGFLSSYVVADCVEVWTSSYQSPEQAWYFKSAGGKRFTLERSESKLVGTRVRLALSEKYKELGDEGVLNSLLSKYCCLLPITIYCGDKNQKVNELTIPWEQDNDVSSIRKRSQIFSLATHFERRFEPLYAFSIPENKTLGVNGVIWIQAGSGYESSDFRNVSVFVRNMHITSDGRDLLPNWAGFIGCVISTQNLTPTASREAIQKDEHYYEIQAYIEECLVDGLQSIAKEMPEAWRSILKRHNQALLGAAVTDSNLFAILNRELRVPTSQGDMTLPQYLRLSDETIHIRTNDSNNYEEVLFKAKKTPVVLGYMFGASAFSERYAREKSVKVHHLGSDDYKSLYVPVNLNDKETQVLTTLFTRSDEDLIVGRFKPDNIPLLILEDKEAKLKKRIEQDEDDRRIGSAALMLARLHTAKSDQVTTRRVLVNMNNSFVREALKKANENNERLVMAASMARSFMVSVCLDISDEDIVFSDELNIFMQHLSCISLDEKN